MKKLSIFIMLLLAASLFAQNDVSGSTYYYVNQGIDEFNNFKYTFQENTGNFCEIVNFYQSTEVQASIMMGACETGIQTLNPFILGWCVDQAADFSISQIGENNPELGNSFGYQSIEYINDPTGKSLETLCDPEPVPQIHYDNNEFEYKIHYGK